MTAFDSEVYTCQGCEHQLGHKQFSVHALKHYKYDGYKRLVCTHCEELSAHSTQVQSRCLEKSDQISHADLVEQMRARGLRTRTKAGRKLKKSELRCKLQSLLVMPSVEAKRSRKRKARNWYDLAQEMKNRGGNLGQE